jgi:hypothetical protein
MNFFQRIRLDDSDLEKKASAAAIIANRIARWSLAVSIIALGVAAMAYCLDWKSFLNEMQKSQAEENELLSEISDSLKPLQMLAGISNGEGAFIEQIEAKPGEELTVQMSFRNISGFRMDSLAGRVVLPSALEFVSGSTVVYNRTNPGGLPNADGIADDWVDLGGYGSYDEQGRGSGSVSFKVRVLDDDSLFVQGENKLTIVCELGGYIDGALSTDTYVDYATVIVAKDS